jgi:hypothetical protein
VTEHRNLIDLIASRAPARKIEAAARDHKLKTVESFRQWRLEHERSLAGDATG